LCVADLGDCAENLLPEGGELAGKVEHGDGFCGAGRHESNGTTGAVETFAV
jgi:hypothetical protein